MFILSQNQALVAVMKTAYGTEGPQSNVSYSETVLLQCRVETDVTKNLINYFAIYIPPLSLYDD